MIIDDAETNNKKVISIKGRIVKGLNESRTFMDVPWVKKQFMAKVGIEPYTGTLNINISEALEKKKLTILRKLRGIEIVPEEPEYCSAMCFHALLNSRVKGAVIIPDVPDYPDTKLEIIAAVNIMEALSLNIGDIVTIEIELSKMVLIRSI